MANTLVGKYIKEWPSLFYTGSVLQAPGYYDVVKFKEKARGNYKKMVALFAEPEPPTWKVEVDSEENFEKALEDEVKLKMEPFKEAHPGNTFKHLCNLIRCPMRSLFISILC